MLLSKTYLFYFMWKNIGQQYKKNKCKTLAQTRNDEFEQPDGSYPALDIQDYIKYIIKKHGTLSINLPVHIYISRINNRLTLEIKHGYKLELQTPETIKLLGSTKKLNRQTKNGENVSSLSLKVIKNVLIKCKV